MDYNATMHNIGEVYRTLGTLVVVGEVSGELSRPHTRPPSDPDDPKTCFEKFQKNRKIMIFHDFA